MVEETRVFLKKWVGNLYEIIKENSKEFSQEDFKTIGTWDDEHVIQHKKIKIVQEKE